MIVPRFRSSLLFLVSAATLVAAVVLLHEPIYDAVNAVLDWAAGRGPWTGVILAALWVPAAILLVPGSILTLGTGFLLGVGWGMLVVSIGSTAGAAAAFAVARALLRDRVRARLEEHRRFHAVDQAVAREGTRVVLLLRLSPLFPYNVLNYAFGATGVSVRSFLVGSWIGMLPGTLLYVYLGAGARTLADAATGRVGPDAWTAALFAAGLVATAAATWLVTRAARRALTRRSEFAGVAAGDVPDERDG
jgi:uncharacterized membrane protein YdjX (TVP38/TMEM64 family)